jgi:hypothetical protein
MANVRMVPVYLPPEAERRLKDVLRKKVRWLTQCWRDYHQVKLPYWRRMYRAQPRSPQKTFPFQGASNLVVPIVSIYVDSLHARYMAARFQTEPLWVAKAITEIEGIEPIRAALEKFMGYVGITESLMDLYRVYNSFSKEAIKLGTSVIKSAWTREVQQQIVDSGDFDKAQTREIIKEGPNPVKLRLEDWMIPINAADEDHTDLIVERIRLSKDQMEQRAFLNVYDRKAVATALTSPDNVAPDMMEREREDMAGVRTAQGGEWAEWHVYEIHMKYFVPAGHIGIGQYDNQEDGSRTVGLAQSESTSAGHYRIVCTYHEKSDALLRCVYNFYPENGNPYVSSRLIVEEDIFPGIGFGEALSGIQQGATAVKNQRVDNGTIANTRIWKVRTTATQAMAMSMFPNAMIPVNAPDDITPEQLGDVYPSAFEEEQSNYDLADKTAGVGQSMQAQGAGSVGKTRGVYSALGTMSLQQAGNSRSDMRVCDLSYPHTKLGQKTALQFAHFGVPDNLVELFGPKDGALIKQAFMAENFGKLAIPIRAATASINQEVERQNRQLLVGQTAQFFEQISNMMVAISNPQIPPDNRDYLIRVIHGATQLERALVRSFGLDDIEQFIPEPNITPLPPPQPQPPGGPGGGGPEVSQGQGGQGAPGGGNGASANPGIGAAGFGGLRGPVQMPRQ